MNSIENNPSWTDWDSFEQNLAKKLTEAIAQMDAASNNSSPLSNEQQGTAPEALPEEAPAPEPTEDNFTGQNQDMTAPIPADHDMNMAPEALPEQSSAPQPTETNTSGQNENITATKPADHDNRNFAGQQAYQTMAPVNAPGLPAHNNGQLLPAPQNHRPMDIQYGAGPQINRSQPIYPSPPYLPATNTQYTAGPSGFITRQYVPASAYEPAMGSRTMTHVPGEGDQPEVFYELCQLQSDNLKYVSVWEYRVERGPVTKVLVPEQGLQPNLYYEIQRYQASMPMDQGLRPSQRLTPTPSPPNPRQAVRQIPAAPVASASGPVQWAQPPPPAQATQCAGMKRGRGRPRDGPNKVKKNKYDASGRAAKTQARLAGITDPAERAREELKIEKQRIARLEAQNKELQRALQVKTNGARPDLDDGNHDMDYKEDY